MKMTRDTKENEEEGSNVYFWVNRNGFPIDQVTWDRMLAYIRRNHRRGSELVERVTSAADEIEDLPLLKVPLLSKGLSVCRKVEMVQDYLNKLQYNLTGMQFFDVRKNRPLASLMEQAREIERESLPIKCLEAVIVGVHLTNGLAPDLDRFPIGFKSVNEGFVHRHVVLGLCYGGAIFGALGLSRRSELGSKPLVFRSLSALITGYITCYNRYLHHVKKVYLGLPVSHDPLCYEGIFWETTVVNCASLSISDVSREVERHARILRSTHIVSTVAALPAPSPPRLSRSPSQSRRLKRRRRSSSGVDSGAAAQQQPGPTTLRV